MIAMDFVLRALAVLVIALGLLNVVFPLLSKRWDFWQTRVAFTTLFYAGFAAIITVFCGATLLATDFLFPESLTFTGFADLLVFLALAAAASALFLFVVEGPFVGVLKRLGIDQVWAETWFAFVHGLATALMLVAGAQFVPEVELATGAGLAAGLIGTCGFHFAELIFVHSGFVDAEEMALMESMQDEEDRR